VMTHRHSDRDDFRGGETCASSRNTQRVNRSVAVVADFIKGTNKVRRQPDVNTPYTT
jgi:hypothetical protein